MSLVERPVSTQSLRLAEELRRVVGNLVRLVRVQADTPSSAQSETLGILDRDGPMSVADLAKQRRVKHQSMRLVTGQLNKAGLVSRMPDSLDGRKQLVAITTRGETVLSNARAARAAWMAAALQRHLSTHERQALRDMLRALERMIEATENERANKDQQPFTSRE